MMHEDQPIPPQEYVWASDQVELPRDRAISKTYIPSHPKRYMRLKDLKQTLLNGAIGVLEEYTASTGRWKVNLVTPRNGKKILSVKEENIDECLIYFGPCNVIAAMWLWTLGEYLMPDEICLQFMEMTQMYRPAIFPTTTYAEKVPHLRILVPKITLWESRRSKEEQDKLIAKGPPLYACAPAQAPDDNDTVSSSESESSESVNHTV